MDVITMAVPPAAALDVPASAALVDPLDDDLPSDDVVVTTRRGLSRLALVATEAGSRFQREGTAHDPMAWMLAPRRLFGGSAAIEACLERDPCLRAVLLHGLSLGLDAEPARIDALLCDPPGHDPASWDGGDGWGRENARATPRRLRLYSAMLVVARGGEVAHLFHASVAPNASVVRERIRSRFGAAAAAQAEIRVGVDLSCTTTAGMMPPAFRAMVESGRRVRWATMASLDVTVESRIPS